MPQKVFETGVVSRKNFDTLCENQSDLCRKVRFLVRAAYGNKDALMALNVISDLLDQKETELEEVRKAGLAERKNHGGPGIMVLPLANEGKIGHPPKNLEEPAPSPSNFDHHAVKHQKEFSPSELEEMVYRSQAKGTDPLSLELLDDYLNLYEQLQKTRSSLRTWRVAALMLFLILVGVGTGIWLNQMNKSPFASRTPTKDVVSQEKSNSYTSKGITKPSQVGPDKLIEDNNPAENYSQPWEISESEMKKRTE